MMSHAAIQQTTRSEQRNAKCKMCARCVSICVLLWFSHWQQWINEKRFSEFEPIVQKANAICHSIKRYSTSSFGFGFLPHELSVRRKFECSSVWCCDGHLPALLLKKKIQIDFPSCTIVERLPDCKMNVHSSDSRLLPCGHTPTSFIRLLFAANVHAAQLQQHQQLRSRNTTQQITCHSLPLLFATCVVWVCEPAESHKKFKMNFLNNGSIRRISNNARVGWCARSMYIVHTSGMRCSP